VPYPLNYGGSFDLFCKLPVLQQQGVHIHLHCFEYGRGRQPELNKYCAEVHYYSRHTGLKGLSASIPYIVKSRYNKELLKRLLKDDHPMLLEGVHCTSLLNDARFAGRKVLVRLHNIEHEYYNQLAKTERSLVKKMYYSHESRLLKKYEASIASKAHFIAVTEKDADTYRQQFKADVTYLPVFLPWNKVASLPGTGNYCLYHGNLSVAENEESAAWLLQQVFGQLQAPLVIAGRDPSRRLEQLVRRTPHARLVANPGAQEMQELVRHAQVHILPAFNATGIKLKLLNALFQGRHCLVNGAAVDGTGLEACCGVADSAPELARQIGLLMQQEFTADMIARRAAILHSIYNKEENGRRLTGMIW